MRSLLSVGFATALLLLLASALPAGAAPLCTQVDGDSCQAACAARGEDCVNWWVGFCDGELAPYTYQCTSSTIEYVCGCTFYCFLEGTEISLADGTAKPIEAIEPGDVVLAYDEESGEMKPDAVRSVQAPKQVPRYLVVNDRIRLTDSHPVLSDGEWVEVGRLEVGDTLTASDGSAVVIESLEIVREPVTVYNFEVNPYGTYVADGVVVHNKPPPY